MKTKSNVYAAGDLRARVTVTRWLRRFVSAEMWTPLKPGDDCSVGGHMYTVVKDGAASNASNTYCEGVEEVRDALKMSEERLADLADSYIEANGKLIDLFKENQRLKDMIYAIGFCPEHGEGMPCLRCGAEL